MITNQVPKLAAAKFGGEDKVNMSEIQKDTRLTYSTVARWIKGKVDRVDFQTLAVWCEYFGVQPGDILVYEPDEADHE